MRRSKGGAAIVVAQNFFARDFPGYKYNPRLTIVVDVPDGPKTCGSGQHNKPADAPRVPSMGAAHFSDRGRPVSG